jgi:hypothetical protein
MRCLWMLEEIGEPYQLIEKSTRADDLQSSEYLQLNPNARIPTLGQIHDFRCAKSANVTKFIRTQANLWVDRRYCGVFIFPAPDDPTHILGYYTLSQFVMTRDEMERRHKSRQVIGSVPLAKIGFMGKQDGAPTGLGAILLTDAARRVYRHLDIPAWGLALEPEGGKENTRLWNWYLRCHFIPAQTIPRLMYANYESLIPELTAGT